jgi:hypothetical protein
MNEARVIPIAAAVGALPSQVMTHEVRWLRRGAVPRNLTEWFSQLPHVTETRVDRYLVKPQVTGLSLKIRGDESIDVKQRQGSLGVVRVAGRLTGPADAWLKTSIPLPEEPGWLAASADDAWIRAVKRRLRAFPLDTPSASGADPSCVVELTEVEVLSELWWTVGFEVSGPLALDRLHRAAAVVFGDPAAPVYRFRAEEATPYGEWIQQLSVAHAMS